jgi:hypothetical protein
LPPSLSLQGAGSGSKQGQQQFDAAAASALVELPEYRSDGLLVRTPPAEGGLLGGKAVAAAPPCFPVPDPTFPPARRPLPPPPQVALCVLQYLAWVVQANAQQRAVTGKPGPAEVALAKRLMDVVKAAGAAEATGGLGAQGAAARHRTARPGLQAAPGSIGLHRSHPPASLPARPYPQAST